jgi:shikimate dehydrogenase
MRIGLIGFPVAHSASPRMQSAAFAEAGLTGWRYELWPTPQGQVAARVKEIRDDDTIGGANVTIPHKQAVMPFLDTISPHASAIGAVNTIVKRGGTLHGDNTDWRGFLADLAWHGLNVADMRRALVLGAGGSARGIVYALLQKNVSVTVVNRDAARAAALAREMNRHGAVTAQTELPGDVSLIVNCTSAGMEPHDDSSPWPESRALPPGAVLYDLVYKPRLTRLMTQAEAAGLRAIGGIGMLVEQGAAAFELWTGQPAASVSPVMRRALES